MTTDTSAKDELDKFEAFVLEYTGRDMDYHRRARTTGLDFAWACWLKAGIGKEDATRLLRAMVTAQHAGPITDDMFKAWNEAMTYLETELDRSAA